MILTTRQVMDRLKAGKTVDIYFDFSFDQDEVSIKSSIYPPEGRNLGTFLDAPIVGAAMLPEGEPAIRILPTWINAAVTPTEVERNLNSVLTLMAEAYMRTTTGRLMMVLS
jgi:hypothetical protein